MSALPALGRVLARLRLSDDADDLAIAEALGDWWAGAPFDRALGLAPGWRDAGRVQARDRALLAMEAMLLDLPCRERAKRIAAAINAGFAPTWRRSGSRPRGLSGLVFDYFAAGGDRLSAERIRRILREVGRASNAPPAA